MELSRGQDADAFDAMKLRDLPGLASLFVDWMEGAPGARALLPFRLDGANLREHAASAAVRSVPRAAILRLLESQTEELSAGDLARKNIQRLMAPESVVVLSSLPAVLAGGPLAVLLKCLSTAKLAADLDAAGIPAIPLCWLDHDPKGAPFPVSVGMLDRETQLRKILLQPSHGTRGAAGNDWPVPDGIEACVAALESPLGIDLKGAAIQELIKAYAPGTLFSRASARFMSAWLAELGIVLLDPRSSEFRDAAKQSLQQSGYSQERATYSLCRREEELLRAGYGRPDGYSTATRSRETGRAEASHGDVFPAPLILLFLEAMLPVAAHVIDHAEIRDFALATPLYAESGIPSPLLWPRASATLLDARSRRNMEKHSITFEALLAGKPEMLRKLARQESAQQVIERLNALSGSIERGLEEIRSSVGPKPDVDQLFGDTQSRTLYQLGKLKERFSAAATAREDVIGRQVDRICRSLLPEGELQETAVGGLYFDLRNSSGFLPLLYDRLDIKSFEHQLISVE